MRTPTEPVPPRSDKVSGTAGTGPEMARYSVPEAARLLGISERAVRKRITANTIQAHKDGTAWVVLLPSTTGAVPGPEPEEPVVPGAAPQHGTGPDAGGTTTSVDLSPLVQMIDRKDAEIRDLTNAAMSWQYRALRAEEKLAALESGPLPDDAYENAPESPPEAPQRVEYRQRGDSTFQEDRDAPVPAEVQLATGWRRWLRRVMGHEG